MVESYRTEKGKTSIEHRFYLCSKKLTAKKFGNIVKEHWGIENRLHWKMDVGMNEDACPIHRGHAAENLSLVRHIAMNLLKEDKSFKKGIKAKRFKAGLDEVYALKVLLQQ